MAKRKQYPFPSLEQIRQEMNRTKGRGRFQQALKGTLGVIIVVAALSVLVASLLLPVMRITGPSMEPEFRPGDIVVSYRTQSYARGDIVAFYYNNKLIIKRVIALGGETVNVDEEGRVTVDGEMLEEPYVSEYALGASADRVFPYEVEPDHLFVMGDNRPISVDSRNQEYGCINVEETVGKVFVRVWPLQSFTYYGGADLPGFLQWMSPESHAETKP